MIIGIQAECRSGTKLSTEPPWHGAARVVDQGELGLHAVDAAHGAHREDREHDHHAHLDDELKQVGDQHAPQAGERGDERRERDHADDDGEGLRASLTPSTSSRILTIARLTQPRMMQLMGMPR